MARAGPALLAAAIALAVGFALWHGSSVPDPVDRGVRAPDFRLPLVAADGEVALSELRGRVVLLNFWATWCKPCEDEMPAMQRLHDALAADGLALVAVSVDEEREGVEAFRERLGLRFPIVWDPAQRVAQRYHAHRFPETLLIDADGVVVERYIGPRDWDSARYVERVRRLIGSR